MLTPEPDDFIETKKSPNNATNMNNIFERSASEINHTPSQQPVQPTPLIKRKNDTFFNEFLTKSDDLIAQTQFKLDKLSKLESITKPLAPKPTILALDEKHKPATSSPTQIVPENVTTPLVEKIEKKVEEFQSHQAKQQTNLSLTNDLNNSKSLIDLKSWEQQEQTHSNTTIETKPTQANPIDLLFDVNENSYSLNTEPLKQRDSYFDLIGITRSDSSNIKQQNPRSQTPTNSIMNFNASSRSNSPYRDDLLDSLIGQQPDSSTITSSTNSAKLSNDFINSLYANTNKTSTLTKNNETIPPINESVD